MDNPKYTRHYPVPLSARDREELFAQWCKSNPGALHEMEQHAILMDFEGRTVSTKYLVECQRYEGRSSLVAVPFEDTRGKLHNYKINNSDTSLLARWLLKRHPKLRIEVRRSMFDGRGAA